MRPLSLFLGGLLLFVTCVSVFAQNVAYQDGIELVGHDSSCYTARCPVIVTAENMFSIPRSFPFDFSQKFEYESNQDIILESIFLESSKEVTETLVSCGDGCINSSFVEMSSVLPQSKEFVESKTIFRSDIFSEELAPFEKREYLVYLENTLGSVWKYNFSFLDPLVDAIFYQSNSSSDFKLDVNATISFPTYNSSTITSRLTRVSPEKSFEYENVSGIWSYANGSISSGNGVTSSGLFNLAQNFSKNEVVLVNTMPSHPSGSTFTYCVWYMPTKLNSVSMLATSNGGRLWYYTYILNNNYLEWYLNPSTAKTQHAVVNITAGVWTHLCWERSESALSIYQNGVQVSNNTANFTALPLNISSDSNSTYFGSDAGTQFWLNGSFDNFRVWNTFLNPDGVRQEYALGLPQKNYTSVQVTSSVPYTSVRCGLQYSGNISLYLNDVLVPLTSCDNSTHISVTSSSFWKYHFNFLDNASDVRYFALYFENYTAPVGGGSSESSGGGGGGSSSDSFDSENILHCVKFMSAEGDTLLWNKIQSFIFLDHVKDARMFCSVLPDIFSATGKPQNLSSAWHEFFNVKPSVGNFFNLIDAFIYSLLSSPSSLVKT